MTELFIANLKIISKKWPDIASRLKTTTFENIEAFLIQGYNQTISVSGIQLSSRHNRLAEAQLFISTLPIDASHITVYGVGMGDVPSLLIDNPQYLSIDVCILNISIFALLISYTDQSEWLSHPNINLNVLPSEKLNFPHFPNIAITPDLTLVSDDNAALRDLLVMELNLDFSNQRHKSDDPAVLKRFDDNQRYITHDLDAASLINSHCNDKAIVIGSGPSLEEHYDYLKQMSLSTQRPLIIAADTALRGLLHNSIKPDFVICIDGLIGEYHLPLALTHDINLVYFPRVDPIVLNAWLGQRYTAYGGSNIYDTLASSYPKLRLFTNGSVIHPAIDLAVKLKAKEITLLGCDFCYCNNKSHAFWNDHKFAQNEAKEQIWVKTVIQKVKEAKHWVLNGKGQRVATDLNLRAYLRHLELYIAKHPEVKFYQASLSGAKISGSQYKDLI
ncbi:6-hydroxymethylpterin diphosphokinase MptE-like protein [Shewanella sp. AC34-MNA-CIBAN-0136]|uniref:motility associated factor glycosyltransferase family protein n=2 Tax=Gammaproteobacteria TaxID=1236 RepID=UPI0033270A6F